MVQRLHRGAEIGHRHGEPFRLVAYHGGQAGFGVEGPPRLISNVQFQSGHFGGVAFRHLARVLLLAREFLLHLDDTRAPLLQFPVQRLGPLVASLPFLLLLAKPGGVAFGHFPRALLLAREFLLKLDDARAPLLEFPVQRIGPLIAAFQLFLLLAGQAIEFGEILLGRVEPFVLSGQFSLEQRDVALPLAKHVGGSRHVDISGIA